MRRLAIIPISDCILCQIFREGTRETRVLADPLPADARLIDVRYDVWTALVHLTFESESFPEVEEGKPIPQFNPLFVAGEAS